MATTKFTTLLQRRTNRITRVLIYAVLEWTLISLLLLNSLLSLLIHKFAIFFGLKPPCILCSNLDHHFSQPQKTKTSFFWLDRICEKHAAEISKIGYCSHHKKLLESQSICFHCSSSCAHGYDVVDDVDVKKCSCCDGVIKFPPLDQNTGDLLINQREQVGFGSDSESDSKFGYKILDDDEKEEGEEEEVREGDVRLKSEKEPLLKNGEEEEEEEDKNISNKEIVSDRSINLCPDTLPQHLEFYIDRDDYRLIPVDLINSVKVQKQVVSRHEEDSNEFELVFEGDELLSGCLFIINKENLPCIKEEEDDEEEDIHTVELEGVHTEDEEKGNIGISQSQQEENKSEDKMSYGTMDEQEEEKMEMAQPHQEENKIEEKTYLTLHEQEKDNVEIEESKIDLLEEEKIEISQPRQEENKIGEMNKVNVLEEEEEKDMIEEEKMEISQHLDGDIIEERNLVSAVEGDTKEILQNVIVESIIEKRSLDAEEKKFEEDLVNSLPCQEENKIDEKTSLTLQKQEKDNVEIEESRIKEMGLLDLLEDEKIEISQLHQEDMIEEEKMELLHHLDGDMIVERNSESAQEEDRKEILQNVIEESIIEKRSLDVEEKKVEEDSVNSLSYQEKKSEIENLPFLQVEDEEDRVTEPTEMASNPFGNNGDIVNEVSDQILKVNVNLSQTELEEEKIPDTPSSVESLHNLHKKLLVLGRRGSATYESMDGSMASELEGGDGSSVVEKLKSELHLERKALRALYKELEEERSASAIAANQTMAMINRLQEEKATMQMEALQYQRMLEEQSEYDQEALQMMNELMVKREKEKQELERELELSRKKMVDYEERERMRLVIRRREGSLRSRNSSASCSYGEESDGLSIDLNHDAKDHDEDHEENGHQDTPNGHQNTPSESVLGLHETLASFEEERQAILEQLEALEEKLFTLAEEEEEKHVEDMKPFEQFYEEHSKEFDVKGGGGNENGFSFVNGKHLHERNLNGSMQKRLLPLFDATELESRDEELEGKEEGFDYLEVNKSPIAKFEMEKKRVAIEEEIDIVYERLQAFEADREFLKHCIGSLRKGDKGLDLLQEILKHLRDLKNVELQARKSSLL